MLQRAALLVALVASLAGGGCGEDRHEVYTPNTAPRGLGPVAKKPSAEGGPSSSAARPPSRVDPYASISAKTLQAAPVAAAAAQEKPRDYSADLLAAMRGSEACVKPRPASAALPPELMISLDALVLESGAIVTGKASAAVLTPEELECVKRRLESTRIAGDVKDAPRRVSSFLKLSFKSTAPTAQNAAAPTVPTSIAPAPAGSPVAPEQPAAAEQTAPADTSGTQDEPEAIAPNDPSAVPPPSPSAAPTEY